IDIVEVVDVTGDETAQGQPERAHHPPKGVPIPQGHLIEHDLDLRWMEHTACRSCRSSRVLYTFAGTGADLTGATIAFPRPARVETDDVTPGNHSENVASPAAVASTGEPRFHVVLVEPEIAANAGAIGRTCVAAGAMLWMVRPLGFHLDDRHLRRAG